MHLGALREIERVADAPVCMNCMKMRPPFACTASVTLFHAATWACE